MEKQCIHIGPYIMKMQRSMYLVYIEFYTADNLQCIVRFPLGPDLIRKLDSELGFNELWGVPFSINTPIVNTAMEYYIFEIGNTYDFPNEEDEGIRLEIFKHNPIMNRNEMIFSVPISHEDVTRMRVLIHEITFKGALL